MILQSFDVSNKSVFIFANLFDVCDKFKINLVFFELTRKIRLTGQNHPCMN